MTNSEWKRYKSLVCIQIPHHKRKSWTSSPQLSLSLNIKLFHYSTEARNYFVSFIQVIYCAKVKITAKWFLFMWYIQIVKCLTFVWSSRLEGIHIKYHNFALSSCLICGVVILLQWRVPHKLGPWLYQWNTNVQRWA